MKHLFKGLVASAMVATMCLSTSISASAATSTTYHGSTYTETSGGNGGSVKIRARAFTEYYQPYGSVNVYRYGVAADITTGSTLLTKFVISGTVSNSSSSAAISNEGTGNSLRAFAVSSSSGSYNHVNSTIDTSSSSYGTSHQECNYDL